MPWRFETLPAGARQQLRDLGLDAGLGKLRPPSRLALATGLLFGLAMAFFGQLLRHGTTPAPRPEVDCAAPAEDAFCIEDSGGGWVYAGTPWATGTEVKARHLKPGDAVHLVWEPHENQECILEFGQAEIWRCARETPIRLAMPWPRRRLAVLQASTRNRWAQAVARTLLDGGSVDALLLGLEAEGLLEQLTGPQGPWQASEELLWFVNKDDEIPDVSGRFSGRLAIVEVRDPEGFLKRLETLPKPTSIADLGSDLAGLMTGP